MALPCSWKRTNDSLTANKLHVAPGCVEPAFFNATVLEMEFIFARGNLPLYELVETQTPRGCSLACRWSQTTNRSSLGCTQFDGIRSRLRKVSPKGNLDEGLTVLSALTLLRGEIEI